MRVFKRTKFFATCYLVLSVVSFILPVPTHAATFDIDNVNSLINEGWASKKVNKINIVHTDAYQITLTVKDTGDSFVFEKDDNLAGYVKITADYTTTCDGKKDSFYCLFYRIPGKDTGAYYYFQFPVSSTPPLATDTMSSNLYSVQAGSGLRGMTSSPLEIKGAPAQSAPSKPSTLATIAGFVYLGVKDPDTVQGSEFFNYVHVAGVDTFTKTTNTSATAQTNGKGNYAMGVERNYDTGTNTFKDSTYKIYVHQRVDPEFLEKLTVAGCGLYPMIGLTVCLSNAKDIVKDVTTEVWLDGETTVTIKADGTIEGDPDIVLKETTINAFQKALATAIKTFGEWVQTALKWIMSWINALLTKTEDYVLGKTNCNLSTEACGVMGPWVAMRNIGLSLLVIALLIIAFANVFQINLEQYGLNRMIPRIIVSIALASLSWIIVVFFFDFSTVLQRQAAELISGNSVGIEAGLTQISNLQLASTSSSTSTILTNIGSVILLLILLVAVLVCGVVLFFLLIARIVMLCFLLAVAPLAFILNIVPFTSNLYKQWWSTFFKWMFMGPMAMIIIALGWVIATSMSKPVASISSLDVSMIASPSTSGGGSGETLIGLIIFAASLYMAATIPMQWSGKIMGKWAGIGKKGLGIGKAAAGLGFRYTGIPGGVKQSINAFKEDRADKRAIKENWWAQKAPGKFRAGMDQGAFETNLHAARLNEGAKKIDTRSYEAIEAAYSSARTDGERDSVLLAGARANRLNSAMKKTFVNRVGDDTTGLLEEAGQKDYLGDMIGSSNNDVSIRSAWGVVKKLGDAKESDIRAVSQKLRDTSWQSSGGERGKIENYLENNITPEILRKRAETRGGDYFDATNELLYASRNAQVNADYRNSTSKEGAQKDAEIAKEYIEGTRPDGQNKYDAKDIRDAGDIAKEERK